jgi:hypothetical protein
MRATGLQHPSNALLVTGPTQTMTEEIVQNQVRRLRSSESTTARSAPMSQLQTLAHMVLASAQEGDSHRCSLVAHRYLNALLKHLASCGRQLTDGPDGLLRAVQQLWLLTATRRVIESTVASVLDKDAASLLLARSLEYVDGFRRSLGYESIVQEPQVASRS